MSQRLIDTVDGEKRSGVVAWMVVVDPPAPQAVDAFVAVGVGVARLVAVLAAVLVAVLAAAAGFAVVRRGFGVDDGVDAGTPEP